MLDQTTVRGRIVAAALRVAERKPWQEVTLQDIAEAAQVSLVELRREFSTKGEILVEFSRSVDEDVLMRAPKPAAAQDPRDRLFEVIMSRFDILAPYKSALRSITRSGIVHPRFVGQMFVSQYWMLQAAGVGADGVDGGVRVAGLASIYASVFGVWLDDDDPGLARTMAALDRRLRRGARTLSRVEDLCSGLSRVAAIFMPGSWRASSSPSTGQPPVTPESPVGTTGSASSL